MEWYLLNSDTYGIRKLTANCLDSLPWRCRTCLSIETNKANQSISIEVAADQREYLEAAAFNWVFQCLYGMSVIRNQLLEYLTPESSSELMIGSVSMEGAGVLSDYFTIWHPSFIHLRGSRNTKRYACDECGQFSIIAAPERYVLKSDVADRSLYHVRSGELLIHETIAKRIPRGEGLLKKLYLEPIEVLDEPLDGLPVKLPETWEEYEAYERSQGREAEFPKRPDFGKFVPEGAWLARQIALHGRDKYVEYPQLKELPANAQMVVAYGEEYLHRMPGPVQEAVRQYIKEHEAELRAKAEEIRREYPDI